MNKISLVQSVIDQLNFAFPLSAADWISQPVMCNYHRHSDYSNGCVTDSVENQENYAKRTIEYGGKTLFTTEHGSAGDQFGTYEICEKYGLKYRHGCEAYWVYDRHEKDRSNKHIVLIAKNPEGRKEINYVLSIANTDGYYYQPRIDLELLLSLNPENVIVTSACVAGWKELNEKDLDKLSDKTKSMQIEDAWKTIVNHFGKSFFFEVQYHPAQIQKEINERILKLSQDWKVQLICGLDSHYVLEENKQKRLLYQQDKNIHYDHENDDSFFMDYPAPEEVYQRFKDQGVLNNEQILQAMMNTMIFESDEMEDIIFDRKFKIPNIHKNLSYEQRIEYLTKNILNRAYAREPKNLKSSQKVEAIRWEVDQFIESDTIDYPLFSTELVKLAVKKHNGILTTTSRGSAASFITNKLLGFTTVDRFNTEIPIHPQRFLTKDRILAGSLPDIDFNTASQEPFIKAARDLLGEHGAYPLMTLGKLKTKNAWKMYARINNVEPSVANDVSKAIDKYNKALSFADEDNRDEISVDDYIPEEYLKLFQESLEYQGITDGFGTHACGVLCFDGDIRREIGLISAKSESKGSRNLVAAIEGKYLDSFGYLKQDFLIVDTVALTAKLFQSIHQPVPTFEELKELVKDDPLTWQIYEKGITCCVNQVEKEETTKKVMRYKPKNIGELSAFVAAIRPGFKSLVNTFLDRRPYSTGEAEIDQILAESSGFMLYQESIMAILNFLGVEMGETYQIIKSISKKKLKGKMKDDLMEKLKTGWQSKFGNLDNFSKVWRVIEDAAAYAFNSPHSYSMAGDSLYSAYFKAHYPDKFYKTAIDHYQQKSNKDKMQALTNEAIQFFGYKMGSYEFGADNRTTNIDEKTKTIYPPLTNIKGFGVRIAQTLYKLPAIYQRRVKDPKIRDFFEMLAVLDEDEELTKSKINASQIDLLIKLDYFHEFGSIPKLLKIKEYYEIYKKINTGVMKSSLEKKGLNVNLAEKYGDPTEKKINNFNKDEYFKDLIGMLKDEEVSLKDRIRYQLEAFGTTNIVDPDFQKSSAFVLSVTNKNKFGILGLYNPRTGNTFEMKFWQSQTQYNPIEPYDLLEFGKLQKKEKTRWNGEYKDINQTKKVYVPIEGEYEYWLGSYRKC